jgi:hypothetical protein
VNIGGEEGVRTPDLLLAKQLLSQLSYIPNLDAGARFELAMLRAYETGVVAALPAITLVPHNRIELLSPDYKTGVLPFN